MRGDGAGGCVGGGCGGFSLIGLLIGVGLTVWLGSMVMDGTFGDDEPVRRDAESLASVVDSPTTEPDALTISVTPATELVEGTEVTVTSDAFAPGSEVRVATCLSRSNLVTGDASACDQDTTRPAVVDDRGRLVVRYAVPRVVSAGATPFDCAAEARLCSVVVTDSTDATRTGAAPLTFRADSQGPEITLPD